MSGDEAVLRCRLCGYPAERNFCAECGAPLRPAGRAAQASKVMLAPLYEYAGHARAIFFPAALVEEVRGARFAMPEVLGFWLAAAALAALASALFDQPSFTGITLPILAEVADALATMALLVLLYAPLHPVLNRGKRGIGFTEFVSTLLAIGALLYPWLMLVRGGLARAGALDAAQIAPLVGTLFFVRAFAALYGRGVAAVIVRMTFYFMALGLLLGMLAPHR